MHNLNQAREWAEDGKDIYDPSSRTKVAIDLILSLPDQWVDAEKVRELADQLVEEAGDFASEGLAHRYMVIAKRLRDILPTPKLPTLADMTQEERKACQWMQCRAKGFSEDERLVIAYVDDHWVILWREDGDTIRTNPGAVTPLKGEPKLKWPSGVVDCEIVEEPEPTDSDPIHTPMQPSEVPPNEPWLIEVDNQKAIGTRYAGYSTLPWAVAVLNGLFVNHYDDRDVTLVHKLVPETHALPEGMRLADHKECGRVVVSQRADKDGNYKVFCSISSTVTGDDWWCAHKSELNFLDGNQ